MKRGSRDGETRKETAGQRVGRRANWKKRLGQEMRGTVAECVARWLDLPGQQKRWCDMNWGDPCSDRHGSVGSGGLAAYLLKHGVPPYVAAAPGWPATG